MDLHKRVLLVTLFSDAIVNFGFGFGVHPEIQDTSSEEDASCSVELLSPDLGHKLILCAKYTEEPKPQLHVLLRLEVNEAQTSPVSIELKREPCVAYNSVASSLGYSTIEQLMTMTWKDLGEVISWSKDARMAVAYIAFEDRWK